MAVCATFGTPGRLQAHLQLTSDQVIGPSARGRQLLRLCNVGPFLPARPTVFHLRQPYVSAAPDAEQNIRPRYAARPPRMVPRSASASRRMWRGAGSAF